MWSFFLELVGRAWDRFVLAVGTTTLGFVVSLLVLPVALHLLKVWRGKAAMKLESFVDTTIGVLAVYGLIYLSMLIFGAPRQIGEQAKAIHSPTYPMPFPPFNWDAKTASKSSPEMIHSLVALAKISCVPTPGVLPPDIESGFSLLSGNAGVTLTGYDDSNIFLRPISPITREIGRETIDVIEKYSLDPGTRPDGQTVEILNRLKTLSVKMVGWGFGPWCARPVQANVSLLVNGRVMWSKIEPIDASSKLEFSLSRHLPKKP